MPSRPLATNHLDRGWWRWTSSTVRRGSTSDVEWLRSPGGAGLPPELTELSDALVIAHEWLDVVPCTVAEVDDDGTPREVLVDPASGEECLGGIAHRRGPSLGRGPLADHQAG